ncbi:thymidylate synthase [Pseudomonadota bacterium]
MKNHKREFILSGSGGEAWKKGVGEVWKRGCFVNDGDVRLKELLGVTIVVEDPELIDGYIEEFGDFEMIEWMEGNFLSDKPIEKWGFSYGERLVAYEGVNQLKKVIVKLKNNRDSKSATTILVSPSKDAKHVPCIVTLDFKVRDHQLMCFVFVRSQDVGKKLYADIISIGKIMSKVAREVKVAVGPLHLFVASLHIYVDDMRDDSLRLKELIKSKSL